MKQIYINLGLNAKNKASIEYTLNTKATVPNNGGVVFTSSVVKSKATVPNNGGVVFPVYNEENIKGNILLKVYNASERIIFKKAYSPKAFVKLNNGSISVKAQSVIKAKFGPGSKGFPD